MSFQCIRVTIWFLVIASGNVVPVSAKENESSGSTRKGKMSPFAEQVMDGEVDCEDGCGFNEQIYGGRVCGANGIFYQNECLAYCQGIAILPDDRDCNGGKGPTSVPDMNKESYGYSDELTVTPTIMNLYADEGFSFVAMRVFLDLPLDDNEPFFDGKHFNGPKDAIDEDIVVPRAVRITSEGYEYISNPLAPMTDVPFTDDGIIDGEEEDSGARRHLKVIGDDSREPVSEPRLWPYRLVGLLEGRSSFCTGTVISRTAILTAAHCVYSISDGGYLRLDAFVPAAGPGWTSPLGSYGIDTVTTYQNYVNGDEGEWDLAVVRLQESGLIPRIIGDRVGYAGMRRSNSLGGNQRKARMTGYPGDYTYGTMVTSGNCGRSMELFEDGNNSIVTYTCDTFGGMSGSSLLDRQGYTYGVHFAADRNDDFNYGNLLIDIHFDNVINWSKRRANTEPQSAQCGLLGFNLFCKLFDPGTCGWLDIQLGLCVRYGRDIYN